MAQQKINNKMKIIMKAIKKIISPVKITQMQDKAIKGQIEVKITLKRWYIWYLYITTIINYIFYGSNNIK